MECEFYEQFFQTINFQLPFHIMVVVCFFQKEEYVRKPGSLVALYRVSENTETPIIDFLERFDAYYAVLEKEGYL